MASKKQLAWRKKFAKMAKAGKFKKKTSKSAKPKKSKFKNKADFNKRAVAGVDYYKDMKTLLGTNDKPKTRSWKD